MLELQVKRHIPEYRDKVTVKNEHSGSIGLLSDLSQLPADIRDDLKKVLEKLAKVQEDE
jgi:phenylacetate-coenzyme A ligase PaaK-like adenylate-forming protein